MLAELAKKQKAINDSYKEKAEKYDSLIEELSSIENEEVKDILRKYEVTK